MPIEYVEHYTRPMIRANRAKTFVFGDNLARIGLGGQAREARYETNAIGIPTKRAPHVFFCNADYDEWLKAAQPDMQRALNVLIKGDILVYPINGIGTGRARLSTMAPRIFAHIREWVTELDKFDTKS